MTKSDFGERKYKTKYINNEVCTCGHRWSSHTVAFFKMAGHCERCNCNAYKRDKTLKKLSYQVTDLSICDRLRGLIGIQKGCK